MRGIFSTECRRSWGSCGWWKGRQISRGEQGEHGVRDSDRAEFEQISFFSTLNTSAGLERGVRPPLQILGACQFCGRQETGQSLYRSQDLGTSVRSGSTDVRRPVDPLRKVIHYVFLMFCQASRGHAGISDLWGTPGGPRSTSRTSSIRDLTSPNENAGRSAMALGRRLGVSHFVHRTK